jgi:hypothetical protein
MYHALAAAGREVDCHGSAIPPILSCGSTSSLGSGATSTHTHNNNNNNANTISSTDRPIDKKRLSSVASAKELPVWLVGTFLLLHCEEVAYQRNLSGQDERRFYGTGALATDLPVVAGKIDFNSLFKNHSLSPRYVPILQITVYSNIVMEYCSSLAAVFTFSWLSVVVILRPQRLDHSPNCTFYFFTSSRNPHTARDYMRVGAMTTRTARPIYYATCARSYC